MNYYFLFLENKNSQFKIDNFNCRQYFKKQQQFFTKGKRHSRALLLSSDLIDIFVNYSWLFYYSRIKNPVFPKQRNINFSTVNIIFRMSNHLTWQWLVFCFLFSSPSSLLQVETIEMESNVSIFFLFCFSHAYMYVTVECCSTHIDQYFIVNLNLLQLQDSFSWYAFNFISFNYTEEYFFSCILLCWVEFLLVYIHYFFLIFFLCVIASALVMILDRILTFYKCIYFLPII